MMDFTICTDPQGSPEWLQARAGRATGSRMSDAFATLKGGGEAASRADYRMELAIERITGMPEVSAFQSADMKWGTEQEPFARMAYEALTGAIVEQTGFLAVNNASLGYSPDGVVDNFDGLLEIKCPKSTTHYRWLSAGVVPAQHIPQIAHGLWITGANWCDFVSYDPRMPEGLRMFVVRVNRGDIDLEEHERKVLAFLREVDALEAEMRARIAA